MPPRSWAVFLIPRNALLPKIFREKPDALEAACVKLGGEKPDLELSYQVIMKLPALPKVPLLLLCNDRDEEFPAQCSLLFEQRAEKYLDMECLAMVGMATSHGT